MQITAYCLVQSGGAEHHQFMVASNHTAHPVSDEAAQSTASESPLNLACARLKSAGLRITQPRIAILGALIARGQPTSIENLHADLKDGACDLVTVYRCLAAFEQIGLVKRSFYHNGTALYAINLGASNAYHVICKETNQVTAIDADTTAQLRAAVESVEQVLKERGYTDVTHVVEFFAVAPKTR